MIINVMLLITALTIVTTIFWVLFKKAIEYNG